MRPPEIFLIALALGAAPLASADSHNETASTNTTGGIGNLTKIHCEGWHVPAHCGNMTYKTQSGTFTASWAVVGGTYAHPLPVSSSGTLDLHVGFEGPVGASADVTMTIEDAGGIMFDEHTATREVPAGQTTTFAFPFTLLPDWPVGDWIAPHVIMQVANEGEADTYIPMVVGPVTPPEVEEESIIPLGWTAPLLGMVAAALLLARRAR